MESSPREITSNQLGVHDDLNEIVNKYKLSAFKKPIAEHTQRSFYEVLAWLDNWEGDVIIDACCGVGESSIVLGQQNPNAKVIGIDKSVARLDKHHHYKHNKEKAKQSTLNNVAVFQADLNDFWRLLADYLPSAKWTVSQQCLFYPNPYPKKAQVQKRWHASPTFVALLACCKTIQVRSNWLIYLQEFAQALAIYGIQSEITELNDEAITPFERKYKDSGQQCWKLHTLAAGDDK